MGGTPLETVVVPELAMSTKFRIEFPPENRDINFAFEDRTIIFPPTSRKVKL